MEGIVGCGGVVLDAEASPRRAAIERAQLELRLEHSVREDRRRELEFLEKGGNPLDFKFSHTGSISVQSTSVTDQPAEQYVTSEAKGSFALPASPHGDSVESSGRPGGSGGGEPNADNSLLLDGENSFLHMEKNAKRKSKRGSVAVREEYSQIDSSLNAKGSEDSAILRLATKGRAYARRNRSRTSRGGANLGFSDSGFRHGYRASAAPFSKPDPTGTNGLTAEADGQAENNGVSAVYDSKDASPKGNIILKEDLTSDSPKNMELDNMNNTTACIDTKKDGMMTESKEVKVTENLQGSVHISCSMVDAGVPNGSTSQSSDNNEKDEKLSCLPSQSLEFINIKSIDTVEKDNGSKAPDLVMTDVNPIQKPSQKDGDGDNVIGDSIMDDVKEEDVKEEDCTASTNHDNNINADGEQSLIPRSIEGSSDENVKSKPAKEENSLLEDSNAIKESNHIVDSGISSKTDPELRLAQANNSYSLFQVKNEVELCDDSTSLLGAVPPLADTDSEKANDSVSQEPEMKFNNSVGEPDDIQEAYTRANILSSPASKAPETDVSRKISASISKVQNYAADQSKLEKEHEDAILKEAQRIEAMRKRAGEQSLSRFVDKRYKCHWDFLLEEMAWMANDFMQERLWKVSTAAQISRCIATCGKAKFMQSNMQKQKSIAKILAKAVMQFWHSAEISGTKDKELNGGCQESNVQLLKLWRANKAEISKNQVGRLAIQDYAVRFLKYHGSSSDCSILAEAPATPDRQIDVGILEMSWEDKLSEESLFYTVPPGALRAYRESIESQSVHTKKTIISANREDCGTSMCGSPAGPRENAYEEDEGDTGTYMFPGASSGGLSSKHHQKKKKHIHQKSYGGRLYDVVTDMSYEPCLESNPGAQSFLSNGKRPSNILNVGSIPTKRIRTASRQRVVSPFAAGGSAALDVATKTDASSGDTTSSLQDDQSSLNGGSLSRKNFEVESTMDFNRRVAYDSSEIMKAKKKKKPKHLGYKSSANFADSSPLAVSGKGSYEQRLHVDSLVQHEQKDHSRKRLEGQHFDSIGVAYGHNAAKKPKLLKQLPDTPPEVFTPLTGSLPSPVASQMSNMSNSNKLIRIISNRDRGKKSKVLKIAAQQSSSNLQLPAGQFGTGMPWSNFEDQALVVLVHDMGPNWELISDAINSTLQFKCIFRKPTECKERHKFLMDKSAGDGADSAEDSGSSQPYPSTLPGIPKGSARQLFQRLQGPMEEDTLKAHFEKIIFLGQQLHSSRRKNDQEAKQIIPPHSSHVVALSQVSMNNTDGGILMPLDFCDATASSPEAFSLGFQGSHSGGLTIPPRGPVLPSTGANTMLQGSPGIVLNNSLPSASVPLNHSPRDAQRYTMQRSPNLPLDDPQRVQQYGQLLSGRNIQHTSMGLPGSLSMGIDPGVRMLPGGSGMGMKCPINRSLSMPRTGFQGLSPANMLTMVSTGSMLSNGGQGMQSSVNVHPNSGAGNSMLRSRDSSQILRPGQNTEEQRQMMMQELQLQFSQGNGQTVIPFNAMSAPFSNATVAPPIQTFPVQQHQQSHQFPQQPHMLGNPQHPHLQGSNHTNSQQQANMRFAKDRQLQHRIMPQSQRPFTGNIAIPSTQNNSQAQSQMQATPAVTAAPSSQTQHKQPNIPKNPQSGIPNQIMKQKQRQQVQQQQPKQQPLRQQGQPQAKLVKGLGRGSVLMHPNLPGDVSQVGGHSTAARNKVSGKHLMQQGQGFFSGSPSLNPALTQFGSQNKIYPRPLPQSSNQTVPVAENCNQGHSQGSTSSGMLGSQQSPIAPSVPLPSEHQQPLQRYMSQPQQAIPKMLQQNRQMDRDVRVQSSTDSIQVAQMVATAPVSHSADLVTSAPMVSPATQWKPESSYDTIMPNSTGHAASSSPESMVGDDTVPHPSSQGIVNQQISGSMPMHGHGLGEQWQQQQTQSQQQQQQPKHQLRQVPHGNLFVQPSNSAPG